MTSPQMIRKILLLGFSAAFSGCAVSALRSDYKPPAKERKNERGPVLNLSNFHVTVTGANFEERHREALQQSLAQTLASSGSLARVDIESAQNSGSSIEAALFLDVDRHYNWWITWPAIYPCIGYWPIQAYKASAHVRLEAHGDVAGRPLRFESRQELEQSQYVYGFYVSRPLENQISLAYDRLFFELRDSVASLTRSPEAPAVHPPAPESRPVRNIAVWDLDPNGVDSATARVVADQITSNLLQKGRFTVLERRRMSDILAEQGFQQSGACDNQGCLVQVGKLLGVDAILAGTVSKVQGLYIANIRLIDVQSGKILAASQATSSGNFQRFLSSDLLTATDRF